MSTTTPLASKANTNRAKRKSAAAKSTGEPTFADILPQLASADIETRSKTADASAIRARRGEYAVVAIRAAYGETLVADEVQESLLSSGIAKGTVSKMVTVLRALQAGKITTANVNSLNGAYNLVKDIEKIEKGHSTPAPGVIPIGGTEPVTITPDDALSIILQSIKSAGDGDAVFKAAGAWITRFTTDVSALTKSVEEAE